MFFDVYIDTIVFRNSIECRCYYFHLNHLLTLIHLFTFMEYISLYNYLFCVRNLSEYFGIRVLAWRHLNYLKIFNQTNRNMFTLSRSKIVLCDKQLHREVKMSYYSLDDSGDTPLGGRKGKTCSMSHCNNTHQRFPNMSFFRFPKELSRFVIQVINYYSLLMNQK